jgi:hypothetical protein
MTDIFFVGNHMYQQSLGCFPDEFQISQNLFQSPYENPFHEVTDQIDDFMDGLQFILRDDLSEFAPWIDDHDRDGDIDFTDLGRISQGYADAATDPATRDYWQSHSDRISSLGRTLDLAQGD